MSHGLDPDMPDEELRTMLRAFLSTDNGRSVLYWLVFEECNLWQPSLGATDRETNYNEGRRSVGVQLMARIQKIDPAAYGMMLEEHRGMLAKRILIQT